jgi:hypothetical protein
VSDYFSYQSQRQQRKDAPKPTAAPAPEPPPPPAAPIEVKEFDPASTTIVQRFRHALARKFRDE